MDPLDQTLVWILLGVVALAGFGLLFWRIAGRRQPAAALSLLLGVIAVYELLYDDDYLRAILGAAGAVIALMAARKARLSVWPGLSALFLNVGVVAVGLVAGPSRLGPAALENERETYQDMRNFRLAEQAYALVNGNLPGEAECLLDPAARGCAREGRDSVPFVRPSLGEQHGYVRTFRPGRRPASAGSAGPAMSARSLETWALVAVPVIVGKTGRRGFCLDSARRACFTPNGTEPSLGLDGLCGLTQGPAAPQRNLMERIQYKLSGRRPDAFCHVLDY